MKNQTILTLVGVNCTQADLVALFDRARSQAAHLAILVVGASPRFPVSAYAGSPYGPIAIPDEWQDSFAASAAALQAKAEDIEALLSDQGVSGDVATVHHEPAALDPEIARRANLCDLAVIGGDLRAEPAVFDHVLRGILFSSAIGVVLNDMSAALPRRSAHVMIAWNTSLPSARAVHAALPLLMDAEQVSIACFDPVMTEFNDGENPGSDLAKWLSHRGCHVTVQQFPSGGKEVGACIQQRAKEVGADMVVMGAYGHARMRQAVFGGTTRTLVEQTEFPVLLAH